MTAPSPDDPFLVAGAGIGGLSAAIALARTGFPVNILERSNEFLPAGAGIQLGPNATRILREWGVLESLVEHAVSPLGIHIHDGKTGRILARVPLGQDIETRHGAPYLCLHRHDLHNSLLKLVKSLHGVILQDGCEVTSVTPSETGVTAKSRSGAQVSGLALIAADGLWSHMRSEIDPTARLKFSGKTAWRALLDIEAVPHSFRGPEVHLWMAPHAHLVHYPVSKGQKLNIVAVIKGDDQEEGWDREADAKLLENYFREWPEQVRSLLSRAPSWRTWSLMEITRLKCWSRDRLVLLGDAAHPILPFLAQGGAMAIEDAACLAGVMAKTEVSPPQAFKAYETSRRKRTATVQTASRRMGSIYHLKGLAALGRNAALRSTSPEALLRRYDWLYGYRLTDY